MAKGPVRMRPPLLSGFFRKAQIYRLSSVVSLDVGDLWPTPEIHLWTCRPDVTGRRCARLLRFRKSCRHDVHSQSKSELPNFRQSNDAKGYSVPAKTRRNAATPASAKFSSRLLVCTRSFNLFWKAVPNNQCQTTSSKRKCLKTLSSVTCGQASGDAPQGLLGLLLACCRAGSFLPKQTT